MANEVLERDPIIFEGSGSSTEGCGGMVRQASSSTSPATIGSDSGSSGAPIGDYRMSYRTFESLYARWCAENQRKRVNLSDKNNLRHTLRRAHLSMRFETHTIGGIDFPENWIIGIRRRAMTAYGLEIGNHSGGGMMGGGGGTLVMQGGAGGVVGTAEPARMPPP